MATARKNAANTPVLMTPPEQNYLQGLPDDEDFQEETASDRVFSMLENIAADTRALIKIYRTNEKSRNLDLCDEYTPGDFEAGGFKLIRDRFGAGDYELRFWGVHPDSQRYCMLKRVPISLAPVLMTASEPVQGNSLNGVLEKLTQQIIDMRNAPAPAPVDPMTQMTQMFTMMKLMREAMGTDSKPTNQLTDIVAAMREMKEVAREFTPPPESDKEPGIMSLATELLGVVKGAQQPAQRTQRTLPAPTLPASLAAAPSPSNQSTDEPEAIPMTPEQQAHAEQIEFIRSQIGAIIMMARVNGNPENMAAGLYEMLPDEAFAILLDESWFKQLCEIDQRCEQYQAWFTEVRTHLVDMYNEDAGQSDDASSAHTSGKPGLPDSNT